MLLLCSVMRSVVLEEVYVLQFVKDSDGWSRVYFNVA